MLAFALQANLEISENCLSSAFLGKQRHSLATLWDSSSPIQIAKLSLCAFYTLEWFLLSHMPCPSLQSSLLTLSLYKILEF